MDEQRALERKRMRSACIAARNALTPEERLEKSRAIAERLVSTQEFKNAETVMIYRATKGEVRLEPLEERPEAAEKRLCYPLCISKTEMIALIPQGEDAWQAGYMGIGEPVKEKSEEIAPEDIDLIVCPCSGFDESCARMGMGAGFYDRFLERCVNASVIAVAFEAQKAEKLPTEPWDRPMGLVVTESRIYRAQG